MTSDINSQVIKCTSYIFYAFYIQRTEMCASLYKLKISHNKTLCFNGVYCNASSMPKHEIEISLFSTFPLSFHAGRVLLLFIMILTTNSTMGSRRICWTCAIIIN